MTEELVTMVRPTPIPQGVIDARKRASQATCFNDYVKAMIEQEQAWNNAQDILDLEALTELEKLCEQ